MPDGALSGFSPFAERNEPFIAAESEDFLVVFKPAGMHSAPLPVERKDAFPSRPTPGVDLASWLASARPDIARAFDSAELPGHLARRSRECGLLSRLDMDTSGIILAAKTPALLLASLAAAESGRIRKTYRLIAGRPEASSEAERGLPGSRPRSLGLGTLEARLSIESRFRPYGPKGARVACIEPGPEGSSDPVYVTVLRRIEKDSRGAFVLEAEIGRGYRHQIRAHTAWTGFPIQGDRIYGGMAAPRLMLEACGIEVDLGNGKAFRFDLYA